MKTKRIIEGLTEHFVAVRTIVSDGDKVLSRTRSCFGNTEIGRESLQKIITKTAYKEILKVWGKEPAKK